MALMAQKDRWRYSKWRAEKIGRRLKSFLYSQLYRNPNRDLAKSILISGSARSGTTWLADILSAALNGRIMFEPFNARQVRPYSQFNYFQYMRPEEENPALEAFCRQLFTGAIRNAWIDRQVEYLNAEFRVIKAIRANLLLKWVQQRFPDMPQIFIIRHPCAVVSSRMELGWDTDKDIEPFLSQPKLVEDFLGPHLDTIREARTDAEKHAVIWCVTNLIPLKQFKDGGLEVIYYENLCTQPNVEMHRIFAAVNRPFQEESLASLTRPSTTSLPTSAILTGDDRLESWRKKLTDRQVDAILTIVDAFGLDHIYGENIIPSINNPSSPLLSIEK